MKLVRAVLLAVFASCLALLGCVFYLNPQCTDLIHNGTESDVDCGGICGPCQLGRSCQGNLDCENGNCVGGTCRPLPCENGVKDVAETDVDCGGPTCRKCAGARGCTVDGDCFSGKCDRGTCSSLRAVSFADAVVYPAGFKTYTVLAADMNRDGLLDLVACNEEDSSVSIYLGRGDGNFDAVTPNFRTGEFPTGAVIADFNKDGILDIATANFHGDSVSVLLGAGDGRLGTTVDYPTQENGETQKVAAGDLDHDGNLDLIAVNLAVGSASQFKGRGDGTFEPAVNFPVRAVGSVPIDVALADLDGDGNLDVAIVESRSGNMVVRLGNGDGSFGPEADFAGAGQLVIVADMNNDGKPDLVSANRGTDSVSVLIGRGDGTFLDPLISTTGRNTGPFWVAVADFNVDGVLDVVAANFNSADAIILLGAGDGRFDIPLSGGVNGELSYGVVAGDFDRDGRPDFATCNAGMSDVKVNLSTSR